MPRESGAKNSTKQGQGHTLWRALIPLQHYTIPHDAAVQIGSSQPDDPSLVDAFPQTVYAYVVVDAIKEFLQIDLDHNLPASLDVPLRRQYRVVGSPSRPKAVAVFAEGRVMYRLQHLQPCLLDQSIRRRRDAPLALTPVRFRDRYPSYRLGGPVRPPQ